MRCDYAPANIGLATALLTVLAIGLCPRPAQADAVRTRDQFNMVGLAYDLDFAHSLRLGAGFAYRSAIDDDWRSDALRSPIRRFVPLRPIRLPRGPSATGFAVSSDFLEQVVKDTLTKDKQPQTEIEAAIAELNRQAEPSSDDSRQSFLVLDYQRLGGAFTARDLQSDLDLVFSGDIKQDNNPWHLLPTTDRVQVSLQFDQPLKRRSERNSSR